MTREQIEAEIADLKAKNEAATSWGAAVGARSERIKGLEQALRAMAPDQSSAESCDLKPCPFCGKPAEYVCESDHHGDYFRLGCIDEDCAGHWTYYTQPQDVADECIARWNTRPVAQSAPGHTDLMVTPESIDAFLDVNPPPANYADLVRELGQAAEEYDRGHGPLHAAAANAIQHLETLLHSAAHPPAAPVEQDPASTFTDEEWHDALMGDPRPRSSADSDILRPRPCPQEAHDPCVWPRCDCAPRTLNEPQGAGK